MSGLISPSIHYVHTISFSNEVGVYPPPPDGVTPPPFECHHSNVMKFKPNRVKFYTTFKTFDRMHCFVCLHFLAYLL